MALTKYKLGELIERSTVNNKDLRYGTDLIAGVNNEGVFTVPKGNPAGVDLRPYKLVNNGAFVYNPTRLNLGSIAYRTQGFCIVSHLYIIFYLNAKGKDVVDPFYLYIYFHRDEFHREVTFRNFGSQRPEFSFNDMADLEITLPDIDQQRKFVDVYLALQNNLAAYQSRVDELKTVCDGYIDNIKKSSSKVKISDILEPIDKRNSKLEFCDVQGINIEKSSSRRSPILIRVAPIIIKLLSMITLPSVECKQVETSVSGLHLMKTQNRLSFLLHTLL